MENEQDGHGTHSRAFAADMDRCLLAYYAGERDMLFEAINLCGMYRAPLPDWIRYELREGLLAWRRSSVREFGEAFGIQPKSGKIHSAQRQYDVAGLLYQEIERRRAAGDSMTNDLWEEVGAKFAVSRTVAKEYHQHVKDELEAMTEEQEAFLAMVPGKPK